MERKKTLPFKYPPITSFPPHANLLSVILNYKESLPWFFSHYIQLVCLKDICDPAFRVDFFKPALWHNCPFIYNQKMSRDLISRKWKSFIDFIIDCLDLGHYLMFNLDTYFVSAYPLYRKFHRRHDIFIFGYDLDKKTFDVADFFIHGKYNTAKASFLEIEKGYQKFHLTKQRDYLNGIEMIKFLLPGQGYEFDISIPARFIEEYLLSSNTCQRYDLSSLNSIDNTVYGISIYNTLIDYVQLLIECKIDTPDLRSFHIFFEHKKAMIPRIQYFIENNYLKNEESLYNAYIEITNKTQLIRDEIIKYIINADSKLLYKVISELNLTKIKEVEILQMMLDEMHQSTLNLKK
jgi:hypothetical protein